MLSSPLGGQVPFHLPKHTYHGPRGHFVGMASKFSGKHEVNALGSPA